VAVNVNAGQGDSSAQWKGIGYGLAAAAIWGAWPVASRYGVQQSLDALDITFLRFAVAGLILLPLVLRRGSDGLGWGRSVLLTIGAGAPYVLITVIGLGIAPAGHGGIIIPGAMLTASAIGGWLLLGDRPDKRRWVGLSAILAGLLSLGIGTGITTGEVGIGHLLFVAGGLCWASYTVLFRKWGADPMHATALVSVLSLVGFAPFYFLMQGGASILNAPMEELIFQGLMQGGFAAILALLFYTKAVAALGAARGALFAALVPGLVTIFAYPTLGEVPSTWQIVGLVLATGGMLLALGLRLRR